MRFWRPARGPTSEPVLIVAATADAIGRAGRRLRPEKKPVRAGASPAGLEQRRHGGRRERGRRWATPAAVRRGPDDLPHTRHDERRCGRGGGSSSPARRRVTKVDRQGVAAGDCSPVTASASRLAERGLRSARSHCPTSSPSALARVQQTSAPPSAGKQGRRDDPSAGGGRRLRNWRDARRTSSPVPRPAFVSGRVPGATVVAVTPSVRTQPSACRSSGDRVSDEAARP